MELNKYVTCVRLCVCSTGILARARCATRVGTGVDRGGLGGLLGVLCRLSPVPSA